MTINELMYLCVEPSMCKVTIYDCDRSEMVWHGMADELPDHYLEAEIQSWDVPSDAHMTFNI